MSVEKESIPILLVEDNPADIDIIRKILKKKGIPNPIHIARDGEEAIEMLHRRFFQAGVLILDIHLPKVNGMEVLKEAMRIDPDAVAIMLTSHASMKTAIQSLRREGAFDYLQKSKENPSELAEAVRLAIEKRALRLESHMVIQNEGSERTIDVKNIQERFGLSEREMDVVKLLCQGDSNKELAEKLFISELTVKGHLKNIFQKTAVHNRATLVSKVLAGAILNH